MSSDNLEIYGWSPRAPADRILMTLKMQGALTSAQTGQKLGITGEAARQQLVKLSEEERQELLVGLKLKWAEVNEKSQKMTFTLDTPAKRQRKERYEEQLMQFEKDIEMLSRKNIYVEHGFY